MRFWTSLTGKVLIGVAFGLLFGALFRGSDLSALSLFGKSVIQWLKLIAGPFLFFTILSSLLQVSVSWNQGLRLMGIAVLNTSLALGMGMLLTRGLLAHQSWPEGVEKMASTSVPKDVALSYEGLMQTFTPPSLLDPFVKNDILLIALMALLLGVAGRQLFVRDRPEQIERWAKAAENARAVLGKLLHWVVQLTPFAIFAVLAGTIAQFGFGIFWVIGPFVAAVTLGFFLQVFFVYGFWIRAVAKIPFRRFWQEGREPIFYSLGVNSSLATLPLTLGALKRLGVSDRSASLGAGVATNLNNDGIVLYEAMAVYFTAIVFGAPMDFTQMLVAALVCVVASMGITGIPDAGFISLAVVIGALKLPTELLPLLLSVDWFIARLRSAVNVISDMTLAIALDAVSREKSV